MSRSLVDTLCVGERENPSSDEDTTFANLAGASREIGKILGDRQTKRREKGELVPA